MTQKITEVIEQMVITMDDHEPTINGAEMYATAEKIQQLFIMPKHQLWNMAKTIVIAIKNGKEANINNIAECGWSDLEEEWFDWLEERINTRIIDAEDAEHENIPN